MLLQQPGKFYKSSLATLVVENSFKIDYLTKYLIFFYISDLLKNRHRKILFGYEKK